MLERIDVISKIKEWSRDNEGRTPSEKVFYQYVGIGIYDLKKLGWPFYGALVQEAGLKANKFDKSKYNKRELIELFIATIRENNKWPTRGELDIKHFQDLSFPSYKTFVNQLGLTGEIAQKILDYCKGGIRFEDVEMICGPITERYKVAEPDLSNRKVEEVYMYKYKNQKQPVKVGRSNDSFRRGIELSAGAHDKLELIHSIKTDDSVGVEEYWHKRFRREGRKELSNEWFELKAGDIKAFKKWKKIV